MNTLAIEQESQKQLETRMTHLRQLEAESIYFSARRWPKPSRIQYSCIHRQRLQCHAAFGTESVFSREAAVPSCCTLIRLGNIP